MWMPNSDADEILFSQGVTSVFTQWNCVNACSLYRASYYTDRASYYTTSTTHSHTVSSLTLTDRFMYHDFSRHETELRAALLVVSDSLPVHFTAEYQSSVIHWHRAPRCTCSMARSRVLNPCSPAEHFRHGRLSHIAHANSELLRHGRGRLGAWPGLGAWAFVRRPTGYMNCYKFTRCYFYTVMYTVQ